jgi:hypothetical protein
MKFMRKFLLTALILPIAAAAQFGVKGGLNFANVSGASSINSGSQTGFHLGLIIAPASQGILGYRSEYIFSKQGYDYKKGTNTGTVNLNYLQMSQMLSLNITRFVSLLLGAQTAYLLNAKTDSTSNGIMGLYNRFDYGYAVGAEAHPFKGLVVGARYNVSLNKLYESLQTGQSPSFTAQDAKNNVVQLYVGWIFGNPFKKDKQ